MNVRKSLASRIRGWFPQEPALHSASAKKDFQINPQQSSMSNPTIKLGHGALRATRFLGLWTIVWTAVNLISIVQVNGQHHIAQTSQIEWITAGSIVGLIFGSVVTNRQIRYFERNSKFPMPNARTLFVMLVIAVTAIFGVTFGSFIFNVQELEAGFLSSIFAISQTFFASRLLMFLRYENKKEIYIVQYWSQSGFFAVPKNPPADALTP